MNIYLKYIGTGFIPGVPARDLSEEEAKLFDVEFLIASGLYQLVEEPPKKKAAKEREA